MTDPDRELMRFEDWLDVEVEDLNLEELTQKLHEWMMSIDISRRYQTDLIGLLIKEVLKQDRLSDEAKEDIHDEIKEIRRVIKRFGKKWSKEDERQFANLYAKRIPILTLAKTFGRTPTSLYKKASRIGVKRKIKERMLTEIM